MELDLENKRSKHGVEWFSGCESEPFILRRNFQDVSNKFTQLEHAFRVNLDAHSKLEAELALLKEELSQCRAKCRRIKGERNQWKSAFIRERNFKSTMINTNSDIEETQKIIHHLTKNTQMLDEKLEASRRECDETAVRISKLASTVTDTLGNLDVKSQELLRCIVNALKTVLVRENCMFEKAAAELKLLSSESNASQENENFLQEQNYVLCEIVKDLKKKFQAVTAQLEVQAKLEEKNDNSSNSTVQVRDENLIKNKNDANNCNKEEKTNQAILIEPVTNYASKRNNQKLLREIVQQKVFKSIVVQAYESHLNGMPYEEYIIGFRSGGVIMKFRYSPELPTNETIEMIQLIGTENEYQDSSLKKLTIYIANSDMILPRDKEIYMGVNCGTQTRTKKFINNFTQTILTGPTGFHILSSGKRALERNVSQLEKTVNDLKSTAFEHAKNVIIRDRKNTSDEFFKCLGLLEQ